MPSVITTHSPISASIASITASLANGGGTKTTDTSAAVSFIASSTPPTTVRHGPRLRRAAPEGLRGRADAVRDRVAGGDAAEDVREHALDVRVAAHDVQARGHDLGRRAAADVEEVGGLHAAVLLPGVGDDVQS